MIVQYQEPGRGEVISVFSCMERGAEGNLLEMSKTAYFNTLSITCTFTCICTYMVDGYSQEGGGGQFL